LRATPGGFGTPSFGTAAEVLRVAGDGLVRERDGHATTMPMNGATLADLAAFAGVDLATPFRAGDDTPAVGDPHAALVVDAEEVARLADWWHLGWRALDTAIAPARDAMSIQLWPEHFDAGTSVSVGEADNDRCNLGASPGDGFSDEPYLYVGPWSDRRPGDAGYWNAPFGAVVRRDEVIGAADPFATAVAFFGRGLSFLAD
jgi:hypothetical protein